MPGQEIRSYLNANCIRYVRIIHSPAYTAQEIAASAHVPGRELAKTVMVKIDDAMAMAVLPAPRQVDTEALAELAGASDVTLATEEEFTDIFAGCEVGAMPPFGHLYDLPVYVDSTLAQDEEIAFNAGSHAELIRMRYLDFLRLVQPVTGDFS